MNYSLFVQRIIFKKIGDLVQEICTNEVVEEITDRIYEETGETVEDREVIKELIWKNLQPMLFEYSKLIEMVDDHNQ
jgi:hypothetical protein